MILGLGLEQDKHRIWVGVGVRALILKSNGQGGGKSDDTLARIRLKVGVRAVVLGLGLWRG